MLIPFTYIQTICVVLLLGLYQFVCAQSLAKDRFLLLQTALQQTMIRKRTDSLYLIVKSNILGNKVYRMPPALLKML